MRWAGHAAHMGEKRNLHNILVRKSEGIKPVGRPKNIYRWEDNIKMDLKETQCKGVHWIHLALEGVQWMAFVNMITNLWVLQNAELPC
jgi:hypothetical protein